MNECECGVLQKSSIFANIHNQQSIYFIRLLLSLDLNGNDNSRNKLLNLLFCNTL